MALRAVPDHPKFADLKARLKQPKGAVLGWLEAIWHFTGRFTPRGNIGKYDDTAIEAWVEWNGAPGELIAGLIAARWLDEDPVYRLLVHDWAKHADKAAKNSINRSKEDFCVPSVRTAYPLPVPESSPESSPVPESQSARTDEIPKTEVSEEMSPEIDESWQMLIKAADALEMVRTEDKRDEWLLWQGSWRKLDPGQQRTAIERLTPARYPDPHYAPSLEKYVKGKWRERARPPSNGNGHRDYRAEKKAAEDEQFRDHMMDLAKRKGIA